MLRYPKPTPRKPENACVSESSSRRASTLRCCFYHHLELTGLGRTHQRFVEADVPTCMQREQALVHGEHPRLTLARLHQPVDLVDLVFANEVPDRVVRNEHLARHH